MTNCHIIESLLTRESIKFFNLKNRSSPGCENEFEGRFCCSKSVGLALRPGDRGTNALNPLDHLPVNYTPFDLRGPVGRNLIWEIRLCTSQVRSSGQDQVGIPILIEDVAKHFQETGRQFNQAFHQVNHGPPPLLSGTV